MLLGGTVYNMYDCHWMAGEKSKNFEPRTLRQIGDDFRLLLISTVCIYCSTRASRGLKLPRHNIKPIVL